MNYFFLFLIVCHYCIEIQQRLKTKNIVDTTVTKMNSKRDKHKDFKYDLKNTKCEGGK